MESIKEYENELTRIYNNLNKKYWDNELPEVMILLSDQKGIRKYGDIENNPNWVNKENENGKYIIHIYVTALQEGAEQIVETILHEQCHLYAIINDIEDCKDNYHNKEFKLIAENHHLIVRKVSRYGFGITELDDTAKSLVKQLKVKEFRYLPVNIKEKNGPRKIKMICPKCQKTAAYVSKLQNLICGYCMQKLIIK